MSKRNCLKPIRMWIDGKCYIIRKFDKFKYIRITPIVDNTENQKELTTKISIPSMYYSQLARFRKTEVDAVQIITNTTIKYPTQGKDGVIEIIGNSEESLVEAKEEMHSIIANIRGQLPPLQFIAIPILSQEIKKNFEDLKEKILLEMYPGVEESIFQSVLKLHLTVVVFTLLNDQEKQHALEVLEECKGLIQMTGKPLKIRIKGLKCMNNDYSKANVLYADASFTEDSDSENSLQGIANAISNLFYEKGLCKEYKENVKLHMTIMNSKYREQKGGTPRKRWIKRKTFDATKIMERFEDYYFGDAIFDSVHLSLMSSIGEDGFYKSLGLIHL